MSCSAFGDIAISTTQDIELIGIVAVPKAERIYCMAPNSKHTVHKRIHIVRQDETIILLGADCFRKLFGIDLYTPRYSSGASDGRMLTPAERDLLIHNTEKLLALFAAEFEAQQQQARQAARELELSEQRAALRRRDQEQRKADAAYWNDVQVPPAQSLARAKREGVVTSPSNRWTPTSEPMWRASFPDPQQILTAVKELAGRTGIAPQRIHHVVSTVTSRGHLVATTPIGLAEEWGLALGLSAETVLQFLAEAGFILYV